MRKSIQIDRSLTWKDIAAVARGVDLVLSDAARERIERSRKAVEALSASSRACYGLNTGVGAFSNTPIAREDRWRLSENIAFSHAVGLGDPLTREECRALLAAKINVYALGLSGIRLKVVDRLCAFLELDCLPLVARGGSVGYLTHSAPIALAIFGEGEVVLQGERMTTADAYGRLGLAPIPLEEKEGLSLVSGTGCASGFASLALSWAAMLLDWADVAAAMTFENIGSRPEAFAETVLALRPSHGAASVGERLRTYLTGSTFLKARAGADGEQAAQIQDALSLRAIAQVHGGVRNQIAGLGEVLDRELESATDNPSVWMEEDGPRIVSHAHTVASELALSLDSAAIALAQLGMISERRLDRLVNPRLSGLPAFLAPRGGLESGFQIAQCTATALVGDNRRLAQPASLDGGITTAQQEDFLSHVTPASLKLLRILENLESLIAIEVLAAAQAYDLQPLANSSRMAPATQAFLAYVRRAVPLYDDRRPLAEDIASMCRLMWAMPYPASLSHLTGAEF